ncbi:hypothetical protein [Sphingobacterium arenae]|uniref:Uncharacterized protein n=1 Tax=Sphingobacterium arenae TaxID=1280598 RepID=A0ABR7XYC6_9SPHI|nr:hypothetical protein [Sphingobacterium arenae]MBD1424036.1 hypothetical protein [Sphingobacterium arenae]
MVSVGLGQLLFEYAYPVNGLLHEQAIRAVQAVFFQQPVKDGIDFQQFLQRGNGGDNTVHPANHRLLYRNAGIVFQRFFLRDKEKASNGNKDADDHCKEYCKRPGFQKPSDTDGKPVDILAKLSVNGCPQCRAGRAVRSYFSEHS